MCVLFAKDSEMTELTKEQIREVVREELESILKSCVTIELDYSERRGFYGEKNDTLKVRLMYEGEVIAEYEEYIA